MKDFAFYLIASLLLNGNLKAQEIQYEVPKEPWTESFGNHRAVIEVPEDATTVSLDLLWRRHDRDIENKHFLIIDAEKQDTIKNIKRYQVSQESVKLVFGPARKGKYYFYFLPYQVQLGNGFYSGDYLKHEGEPKEKWQEGLSEKWSQTIKKIPAAHVNSIQARNEFNSFYPMEVTVTQTEKERLLAQNPSTYLVFPENRRFPIRMQDNIPVRWIEEGPSNMFSGTALRNEYYTFQLGVFAPIDTLKNVNLSFSDFHSRDGKILPSEAFTCFNTEGIDPSGIYFTKDVSIPTGQVQAFWIGTDIPKQIKSGSYSGEVTITPQNAVSKTISVTIQITNEVLEDRGDSELWRHSRLRWLNSTAGINNEPVAPYTKIEKKSDNKFSVLGRDITYTKTGFPAQIEASGTSALKAPVEFAIKSGGNKIDFSLENNQLLDTSPGKFIWKTKQEEKGINMDMTRTLEADGYMRYTISIEAKKDINLDDILLRFPFRKEVAQYLIGMDLPGGEVPKTHQAKWRGPHDSFWIGDTRVGLWVELRGGNYHGPLLNLYTPSPPSSWNNNGNGGFRINQDKDTVWAEVYSGKRSLKKGDSLDFEFALLVTPVKPLDVASQFKNRYYHNGAEPMPSQADFDAGVKIINVHHANKFNPYINYPFIAVDSLRGFVKRMHAKDIKVKIYYTIRELTNHVTEIWALRSLGNEIFRHGTGGGYPWLREHLISGYAPQWYDNLKDESEADASVLTSTGSSRWYNYYIEGLKWQVENIDIDGLYLDDVAYDREMLKRMRKVMAEVKPNTIIDLHSNTGFSKGPATQYAEFFQYVDKLWFGESFKYDEMSAANYLVEVSGIPFGLLGDMLHAGGNPWLGMVFGMTVRHPWLTEGIVSDPRPIWKVWDEFKIDNSRMVGFWNTSPAITTNVEKVKGTAYVKDGKTLIALGNFSDKEHTIQMNIDWDQIGLNPKEVVLYFPQIKDFQKENQAKIDNSIKIAARKGFLIEIRKTNVEK